MVYEVQYATIEKLQTRPKGELYLPRSQLKVAEGISNGSKISLFNLSFNNALSLASVFIYPFAYILTPRRVCELDGLFSDVNFTGAIKMFGDKTMEDLNDAFLNSMGPEVPFTTQRYQDRISAIHHGFPIGLEEILKEKVSKLEV